MLEVLFLVIKYDSNPLFVLLLVTEDVCRWFDIGLKAEEKGGQNLYF